MGSVLLMNAIGYSDSSTHSQTNNGAIDESIISAYVLESVNAIDPHKLDKGLDIGFASTADLGTSTFYTAVYILLSYRINLIVTLYIFLLATSNFKFPHLDSGEEKLIWKVHCGYWTIWRKLRNQRVPPLVK